jgi:hypothetical protein
MYAKALITAKRVLLALVLFAVCLPVAFIVTFALLPLWSWIEATYGIESVGHSGPSDWCFWLVWVMASTTALAVQVRTNRRK